MRRQPHGRYPDAAAVRRHRRLPTLALAGLCLAVGVTACSSSDFDTAATQSHLKAAFARTGLAVCSEETTDWNIAGFQSGHRYRVGTDCASDVDDVGNFDVQVARFSSERARDQAERSATTLVRGHRNASVWTYGPFLIVLEGQKDTSDYNKVVDALEEIGAK